MFSRKIASATVTVALALGFGLGASPAHAATPHPTIKMSVTSHSVSVHVQQGVTITAGGTLLFQRSYCHGTRPCSSVKIPRSASRTLMITVKQRANHGVQTTRFVISANSARR